MERQHPRLVCFSVYNNTNIFLSFEVSLSKNYNRVCKNVHKSYEVTRFVVHFTFIFFFFFFSFIFFSVSSSSSSFFFLRHVVQRNHKFNDSSFIRIFYSRILYTVDKTRDTLIPPLIASFTVKLALIFFPFLNNRLIFNI